MRVLLLSKYDRLGASSRMRSVQYLPYLEAHDVDVSHRPLFGDDYVRGLYDDNRRSAARVAGSYLRRVRDVMLHRRFDLVWLEKELLPWLPEGLLAPRPFVVDYDDAIFHQYDAHPNPLVRALLGRKIDHVMRRAAVVIAGNEYLADRARAARARRVVTIPTAVDLERYTAPQSDPERDADDDLVVGWIGTPVTTRFVQKVLNEVPPTPGIRYRLVGASRFSTRADIDWVDWTEADEVAQIQQFDIGIMPLTDTPFERGKCGYKLIQYMACGKPVLASDVGANATIIGDAGRLVADGEWHEALVEIRDGRSALATLRATARRRVEAQYCTKVTAPRLLEVLTSVT